MPHSFEIPYQYFWRTLYKGCRNIMIHIFWLISYDYWLFVVLLWFIYNTYLDGIMMLWRARFGKASLEKVVFLNALYAWISMTGAAVVRVLQVPSILPYKKIMFQETQFLQICWEKTKVFCTWLASSEILSSPCMSSALQKASNYISILLSLLSRFIDE